MVASRNISSFLRLVYIFLCHIPFSLQTGHFDKRIIVLFRFLCHGLYKKKLNDSVSSSQLECLARWRQTFDIVAQPLNPTSNTSRVRMVKSCTIPCLWPQQITLQIHCGSLWES